MPTMSDPEGPRRLQTGVIGKLLISLEGFAGLPRPRWSCGCVLGLSDDNIDKLLTGEKGEGNSSWRRSIKLLELVHNLGTISYIYLSENTKGYTLGDNMPHNVSTHHTLLLCFHM